MAQSTELRNTDEITLVLAGEAGQGVQSIETIIVKVFKKNGYNVFATKEYMSRIRGGVNSTTICISSHPVRAYKERIDVCIPLTKDSIPHLGKRISADTIIIGDPETVKDPRIIPIPFKKIASELGNTLFANTVAVGVLCGLVGADQSILADTVIRQFATKGDEIAAKNRSAAETGYGFGARLRIKGIMTKSVLKGPDVPGELLVNGAEAVALGALSGGCNAVFAYPMTPSTGILTALAEYSKEWDIVVEQVEDEIGVINMALGAWFAGGRAIVTTSGGGFALMTEGVSLAGMTETPVVICLSQRPGPATGLPTRTEQGDLNLALYAGHGYFPRIILAPMDTTNAFLLAHKAFNLADKYQVPVIILVDQYFVDSYYNIPVIDTHSLANEYSIVETESGYKRYAMTDTGVSPRGVPGYGSGFSCADSDEHDEDGRITEDLDGIRETMSGKRMRKAQAVRADAIEPFFEGPQDYATLVIGWGSTFDGIKDALSQIGNKGIGHLHFSQVYPLPGSISGYLEQAKKTIIIENNETGQFADLLQLLTGRILDHRILKSNGMPFSVEELVLKIEEMGR